VRIWLVLALCVVPLLSCQQEIQDPPVIGGVFVGYDYSETPVVNEDVEIGSGYSLKFRAYDLGGDARLIVYAEKANSGGYYNGIIRIGIQDPDGNAFTFYRNHDAEAVDAPVMWKPRTVGIHKVTINLQVFGTNEKQASFEVPFVRQPVSLALIGGIAVALIIVIGIIGMTIRRRNRSSQ